MKIKCEIYKDIEKINEIEQTPERLLQIILRAQANKHTTAYSYYFTKDGGHACDITVRVNNSDYYYVYRGVEF